MPSQRCTPQLVQKEVSLCKSVSVQCNNRNPCRRRQWWWWGNVALLGPVTSNETDYTWVATEGVNDLDCVIKIDTGANVTALPDSVYYAITPRPQLRPTKLKLYGAGTSPLLVKGKFTANLTTAKKTTLQTVYVVADLIQELLSHPASVAIGLVKRLKAVSLTSWNWGSNNSGKCSVV